MSETEQNDDDDYEAKYFASLHYVDRTTIETNEEKQPPKGPQRKRQLGRYWKADDDSRPNVADAVLSQPKIQAIAPSIQGTASSSGSIVKETASPLPKNKGTASFQPKIKETASPIPKAKDFTKPTLKTKETVQLQPKFEQSPSAPPPTSEANVQPSGSACKQILKKDGPQKKSKRPKLKRISANRGPRQPPHLIRRARITVQNEDKIPARPSNHFVEYDRIMPDFQEQLPSNFATGYESMLNYYEPLTAPVDPNWFQRNVSQQPEIDYSVDHFDFGSNQLNHNDFQSKFDSNRYNRNGNQKSKNARPAIKKKVNIPGCKTSLFITDLKNNSGVSQKVSKQSSSIVPSSNAKNISEMPKEVSIINLDSDDDSVVEIPNVTDQSIHIDSSDDEIQTVNTVPQPENEEPSEIDNIKEKLDVSTPQEKKGNCASPVPSIVSSTSDDFIQQDCRRLELLKDYNSSFEFNFNLHGNDLCTNSKSKEETVLEKSQNSLSSQLNISTAKEPILCSTPKTTKDIFATPKSKKTKLSPQNKSYTIPETTLPATFIDIYDSESSDFPESVVDVPISLGTSDSKSKKDKPSHPVTNKKDSFPMDENLFIHISNSDSANTAPTCDKNISTNMQTNTDTVSYVNQVINPSTKEEKTTLEECVRNMKKFYDDSWGGEDFDCAKIKQQLSGTKELWQIDLADKLSDLKQKKRNLSKCQECNRCGHREDRCPLKPKKCYMCGEQGHFESKCPNRICLNCGKPNTSFSSKCRNCIFWKKIKCKICHLQGHPKEYCPDIWRRYHLTTKNEIPLVENTAVKPTSNMHCSGCGKKGHLQFHCKTNNSKYGQTFPFICKYTPIYVPDGIRKENSTQISTKENTPSSKNEKTKLNIQLENSNKQKASSKENISGNNDEELKSKKTIGIIESNNLKDTINSNELSKFKRRSDITLDKSDSKKAKLNNSSVQSSEVINIDAIPDILESENNDGNQQFAGSKLFLSHKKFKMLNSVQGKLFLQKLSLSLNVNYTFLNTIMGQTLSIPDDDINKNTFFNSLNNYLYFNQYYKRHIPHNKQEAIDKIKKGLDSLKENLGNPSEIFNSIKTQEFKLSSKKGEDNSNILSCINEIYSGYKKLNMILIGQAGLLQGKHYVTMLQNTIKSLQMDDSKKNDKLSPKCRETLGRMYFYIFSDYPLYNYVLLLQKYTKTPLVIQSKKK